MGGRDLACRGGEAGGCTCPYIEPFVAIKQNVASELFAVPFSLLRLSCSIFFQEKNIINSRKKTGYITSTVST